jgi:hypothetical protein
MEQEHRDSFAERSLVALCFGLALFVTPARAVWIREGAPWWAPFALWAALIVGGYLSARAPRGGAR